MCVSKEMCLKNQCKEIHSKKMKMVRYSVDINYNLSTTLNYRNESKLDDNNSSHCILFIYNAKKIYKCKILHEYKVEKNSSKLKKIFSSFRSVVPIIYVC
jgi:hypothetical protein